MRGNTKDEEGGLDLLNQGMRWEDIVHGVWLSKDPAGFGDGPNLYLYVHCNPITNFDPLGLETVRAKFQRANVMPLYHAWNILSIGTLGKNDRLVERFESGEISRGQMTAGAVGNGVVAGATVAAGGGAASLAKTAIVKGAAAGFAGTAVDHIGTEAVAGAAGYDSEQDGGALKVAAGTGIGAVTAGVADKVTKGLSQSSTATSTETTVVRTTRGGDKAIRTTRADGSVIDISPKRVKEFVPNTHPKAPADAPPVKVKYENALPGTKGHKRAPTTKELKTLEDS